MSICGSFYRNVQAIVLRSVCLDNDSHFPDEAFSMAIHDAGMFTVKKTNRLKILQDVIDRNLRPGQAAEMLSASSGNTVVIPDCTICNLRHVRGQNNPSDCSARPPSKIISPSARLTSVVTSRLIRVGELLTPVSVVIS